MYHIVRIKFHVGGQVDQGIASARINYTTFKILMAAVWLS